MSNIMERLRDPDVSCATWNAIRHEAADEIERLLGIIGEVKKRYQQEGDADWMMEALK